MSLKAGLRTDHFPRGGEDGLVALRLPERHVEGAVIRLRAAIQAHHGPRPS